MFSTFTLFRPSLGGFAVFTAMIIFAGVTSAHAWLPGEQPIVFAQGDSESLEVDPTAPADPGEESPQNETDTVDEPDDPGFAEESENEESGSQDSDYTPPIIQRDLADLPFPVRRMHELLIEAAKSGDVDRLRPYVGVGPEATMLTFGGLEGDPIEFLKSMSGDEEGYEIMAILQEVLEAGYVHLDKGTDNEIYVWPYFFAYPLDKLSPAQRVEMYRLMTHGDYEEMKTFGAYIFYRVGISPAGRWRFFVAGD